MTQEKRMKAALLTIANNLIGDGLPRPIAYSFALDCAELARAAAYGDPHEKLDWLMSELEKRAGQST